MATILTSEIIDSREQSDGRVWVTERHVFDSGDIEDFRYLAGSESEAVATMIARSAWLPTYLADRETQHAVDAIMGNA